MSHYDLIVIGAGSGNSIFTPELEDRRSALIEVGPLGGTCLNRGCIPSKMLVYTADLAHHATTGERYGITTRFDGADWPAIRDRIFDRIDPIADSGLAYRQGQSHIDVYPTRARFTGEKRLQVGDNEITGDTIVLAAGAHAVVPSIPGLGDTPFHTSDTVMRLERLPSSMVILGGGYIACEMAHVFGSLGVDVTIVLRGPTMLRELDDDISSRITAAYRDRFDVRVETDIVAVSHDGAMFGVDTSDGRIEGEELLVALGREPNGADLGVEATGVILDPRGYVVVDEFGRTNVDGIWALGDISSPEQLKHKANADARIVAHNIAHPDDLRAFDLGPIPAAVFGNPQIATVGMTERDARAAGVRHHAVVHPYSTTAYGWAMEDTTSVAKLIMDMDTGLLIGAHIIGPQASTLIQQCIQGMRFGQTIEEMAREQWYIHPALPEVIEQALLALLED